MIAPPARATRRAVPNPIRPCRSTRPRNRAAAGSVRARARGRHHEHGGDQHAINCGDQQRDRVEGDAGRNRQQIAHRRDDKRRRDCADRQAGNNRKGRDNADLHGIDAGNVRRSGAEYLECRNAGPLAPEIGSDAVADPDPGDDQCGQPDQREKLTHPFEKAEGAGRCAIAVLELESGGRELFFQRVGRGCRIDAWREAQAIFALIEAARLDQSGAPQPFDRGDRHRAQGEAFADPVRFVDNDVADREQSFAIAQRIAGSDLQPVCQCLADDDIIGAKLFGSAHRLRGLARHRADRRRRRP